MKPAGDGIRDRGNSLRNRRKDLDSRWQPWWILGFFSFLVNYPWEFFQAPLYLGLREAEHWPATLLCSMATLGDAVITCVAYGIVALAVRSKAWLLAPTLGRMATFLALGVTITVGMEALNIYGLGRWSYGDAMPLVFWMGISPLVQWMALPPLTIWLSKRHLE